MFFSAAYRDINTLPYISSLQGKKAQLLGLAIYFLGALVFTTSFISYTLFDGLKEKSVSTTVTVENDSCEMLFAVDKSVEATDLDNFILDNLAKTNLFGFEYNYDKPYITYDNSFYSTYQKCIDSVSISCSVKYSFIWEGLGAFWINNQNIYYNVSQYDVFITCYIADKISLTGLNNTRSGDHGPLSCVIENDAIPVDDTLDGTSCLNYFTSSNMTSIMNSLYPASTICRPFRSNPPYQCITYTTKSYLEIISQSLAVASAFANILFSFLIFVFKNNRKKKDDNVSFDDTKSFELNFESIYQHASKKETIITSIGSSKNENISIPFETSQEDEVLNL